MSEREERSKKVEARKGLTVESSQIDRSISGHKSFTTKPKLRRLVLHKQQTVRNRVCALQESFYSTSDVRYEAVRERMRSLLGLYDDQTVLAYLGRPSYQKDQTIEQTVIYKGSGARVEKRHFFRHKLPAKKGYVESLGLGYVFIKNGEWWIHWNHKKQLTLSDLHEKVNPLIPRSENEGKGQFETSKENFSLTKMDEWDNTQASPSEQNNEFVVRDREEREYSKGERNTPQSVKSQHFRNTKLYSHTTLQHTIVLCELDKKIHQARRVRGTWLRLPR